MEHKVLSVTQLNEYIRSGMDSDPLLCQVAVRGEISNYKKYPSGHHYFSLKDEGSVIKCVMFKGSAMRMRFAPENGMQVIALGKVTVYPRDGAYQLYCSALSPIGVGDLQAAFEQLQRKLAAQGLFDTAHKKPLPAYPKVIGIVTSPAGAAIHDMMRIINRRFPLTRVRLLPVRVQGAEAPGEIAAAIQFANANNIADVLIVGRGGGSREDLWAFNDEQVAYAIYDSRIPVISAVGHETDRSISDYVADCYAATPSHAAEQVVPDQDALRQQMDAMASAMAANLQRQIRAGRRQLDAYAGSAVLKSPMGVLDARRKEWKNLQERLAAAGSRSLGLRRQRYIGLVAKLDALSPLKVLTRGYALAEGEDGHILRSVGQTERGDRVRLRLADGSLIARVEEKEGMGNGSEKEKL